MSAAERLERLREALDAPEESRIEQHARLLSAVPPLVPGDWLALEPDVAARVLQALPERLGATKRTALRVRALPFFPGWLLLEAVEPAGSRLRIRSALLGQDELVLIDGDMAKVHAVRQAVFVPGGAAQILDYLRFFTTACRGEKGRFHVVTEPADLSPGESVAAAARDLVRTALLDPILVEETSRGWVVRVRLFYGADLSDAEFVIPSDGACEMRDDTLLAEGALCRAEEWSEDVLTVPAKREAGHGL